MVFKVLASASTCDLSFSRPCVGFGMFAFCCPVHMRRAAPCPLPVTMPKLSSSYLFPGMLMTGGCHGGDRNHGHGPSAHTHQAAPSGCCGPGLSPGLLFSKLARRGGRRATADLSKRTIIAGCGPACLEALTSAIADTGSPGRGRPEQRL